jgi:hypothetical protein
LIPFPVFSARPAVGLGGFADSGFVHFIGKKFPPSLGAGVILMPPTIERVCGTCNRDFGAWPEAMTTCVQFRIVNYPARCLTLASLNNDTAREYV